MEERITDVENTGALPTGAEARRAVRAVSGRRGSRTPAPA